MARDTHIKVRATKEEVTYIQGKASQNGMSCADYVRMRLGLEYKIITKQKDKA